MMWRKSVVALWVWSLALGGSSMLPTPLRAESTQEAEAATLLQKVLDIGELQQYFHVREYSERASLVVITDLPYRIANVRKFGKPVFFVDRKASAITKIKNRIVLESLVLKVNQALVRIAYPTEGVMLTAQLAKNRKGQWIVTKYKIVER